MGSYDWVRRVVVDPINPQRIFIIATVSGNLFRSDNGGLDWPLTPSVEFLGAFQPDIIIDPVRPATIYAIGGAGWKSTDGGDTWNPFAQNIVFPDDPGRIDALTIHPVDSDIIYIGVGNGPTGMFKSMDGGSTWMVYPDFMGKHVLAIAIDKNNPNLIYVSAAGPGAFWAEREKEVYLTMDDGQTWYPTGLTSHYTGMLVINSSTSRVYASTAGGIFVADSGTLPPGPSPQRYIDLQQTPADLQVIGEQPEDGIGYSMTSGDINGDGFDDMIVGAPTNRVSAHGENGPGKVYVIYGSGSRPVPHTIDLKIMDADLVIHGQGPIGGLGVSVATGDLNNDGIDDIIASATLDFGPWIYIIYGRPNWPSTIFLDTSPADVTISGSGHYIHCDDINGDHIDDLITGPPLYVIYGRPNWPSSMDVNSADLMINGPFDGTMPFGKPFCTGDVNQDGINDLIFGLGGPQATPSKTTAYVVYGRSHFPPVLDVNSGGADITIHGESLVDDLAYSPASGDLNGDGIDDIIIGSPPMNRIYIIYGRPDIPSTIDLKVTNPEVKVLGVSGSLGWTVRSGDIDGDGISDVVASDRGKIFGIYGGSLPSIVDLAYSGAANLVIEGAPEIGWSIAIGDDNGDGINDVMFTSPGGRGWPHLGAAYIIHGQGEGPLPPPPPPPPTPLFSDVTIEAGLNNSPGGIGMAWGDYDNDGDQDLYVADANGPNNLFQNNGNGTFSDAIDQTGLQDAGVSTGIAWGDYDNDGDLDLYMPKHMGQPNRLFKNEGNGSFTDVTLSAGPGLNDPGSAIHAAWGDYDSNGYIDLYLSSKEIA